MQNENERNLHLLHRFVSLSRRSATIVVILLNMYRKAALELEKVRSQRIAKLPPPEDPIRDLQTKPSSDFHR